jgi:GNAT superfamily N-acetyltransferase
MAFATWYRGDPLPHLPELTGFEAAVATDADELALINGLPVGAIRARWAAGNVAYVARLFGRPVGFGWVARGLAHIGELGLSFQVPGDGRYLWDFETLRHCRGRGIYPRLLKAITDAEADARRFWIIHAPENLPSGVGIERAGFTVAGELSFRPGGRSALQGTGPIERVLDAIDLLGVRLAAAPVSPCCACGHEPQGCRCQTGCVDTSHDCACAKTPTAA